MKTSLTLLTLFVTLSLPGFADEGKGKHDHDHGHGHGAMPHATILAPAALPDLWAHINAYGKAVADAAAAENLDVLHKQQANLEALIAGLGGSLGDLDEGKRKRVEGMIGNVQRALGQLHNATDAKDLAAAKKTAKSLTGVLAILKAQYPKDVTAGTAEVEDDMGPHEGMLAKFKGADGKVAGYLELKLHDDKGDLELWLARDASMKEPFDLPADANPKVVFEEAKVESVTLAIRNAKQNEDEDGTPNMRGGITNYFIFPGDSGADSAWLTGADFRAWVKVFFSSPGGSFETDRFLLIPHTHQDHKH